MIIQKSKLRGIQESRKKQKTTKLIILWIIHNLKFLFIPGYMLEELEIRQNSYEKSTSKKRLLKIFKSPLFIVGISIIFLLSTLAVFPFWLSLYTYEQATVFSGLWANVEHYNPPSPAHIFGQTFYGFDILARMIFATRPVLTLTLASTIIASIIGIIIGAVSAYHGGWVDTILMRTMDIILSFPGVVFAIIFVLILGSDFIYLILIYSIINIPYFARLIRTEVLKEKELPYIAAAKVAGAKNRRIIFRHILPNCMQPYIIAASYTIARNILSLGVLGFLRFKGSIGWIEWGMDIALALNWFMNAPWAVFYPSLMILLSVLGFLLLGDALADNGLITKMVF